MKILFAARFVATKDPITFVKAGIQLPNHEFTVAGDGSLMEQCKLLAQGSSNIKFLGWINPATISRLMKEADVFCQLDKVENIWSSSLVAAMKNKKAVVCTNSGYTTRYLKDNYHVLLISPQSCSELVGAIERLASDAELRCRLGENAQVFVRDHLSVEKITKEIHRLITSTVQEWKKSGKN